MVSKAQIKGLGLKASSSETERNQTKMDKDIDNFVSEDMNKGDLHW